MTFMRAAFLSLMTFSAITFIAIGLYAANANGEPTVIDGYGINELAFK